MSLGLGKCPLGITPLTLKREDFITGNLRLRGCVYLSPRLHSAGAGSLWQADPRARVRGPKYAGRTGVVTPILQMSKLRPKKKDHSQDQTASDLAVWYIFQLCVH